MPLVDYAEEEGEGEGDGVVEDVYGAGGLESGFEGAFNNYAASDRDAHGNLLTKALTDSHLGFQPMGELPRVPSTKTSESGCVLAGCKAAGK